MTIEQKSVAHRFVACVGAATVAAALAGCGGGAAEEPAPTTALATEAPGAVDAPGATDAERTAQNGLAAIATGQGAGGVVHRLQRSDDAGTWDLDVVLDGVLREVTVSPDGSTVVAETPAGDVDADSEARHESVVVTIVDAIEAAAEESGEPLEGLGLQHAWLEDQAGTPTWIIELRSGDGGATEVRVDATDGTVLTGAG